MLHELDKNSKLENLELMRTELLDLFTVSANERRQGQERNWNRDRSNEDTMLRAVHAYMDVEDRIATVQQGQKVRSISKRSNTS